MGGKGNRRPLYKIFGRGTKDSYIFLINKGKKRIDYGCKIRIRVTIVTLCES